jgi:ribosomal protein S27E
MCHRLEFSINKLADLSFCSKLGQGACPACKRQFVGYKNQIIRCTSCGNTVWQPKSRGGRGNTTSKSEPEIIDVDFEEK